MVEKCYRDINGNPIGSDYVVFKENLLDIIDYTYIKDVFYREPIMLYEEILKENKIHSKKLFKGIL